MNKRDTLYYWYFLAHIPITILIDSCLVIDPEHRLAIQRFLVDFHISANRDFLLQNPPLWLQVFGAFELFFQLPVFFYAAVGLKRAWLHVHVVMMVYGFNAAFTTVVCLVYVFQKGAAHGLSEAETWNLAGLYMPYLLLPGFMMVDCGWRISERISMANGAALGKKPAKTE